MKVGGVFLPFIIDSVQPSRRSVRYASCALRRIDLFPIFFSRPFWSPGGPSEPHSLILLVGCCLCLFGGPHYLCCHPLRHVRYLRVPNFSFRASHGERLASSLLTAFFFLIPSPHMCSQIHTRFRYKQLTPSRFRYILPFLFRHCISLTLPFPLSLPSCDGMPTPRRAALERRLGLFFLRDPSGSFVFTALLSPSTFTLTCLYFFVNWLVNPSLLLPLRFLVLSRYFMCFFLPIE